MNEINHPFGLLGPFGAVALVFTIIGGLLANAIPVWTSRYFERARVATEASKRRAEALVAMPLNALVVYIAFLLGGMTLGATGIVLTLVSLFSVAAKIEYPLGTADPGFNAHHPVQPLTWCAYGLTMLLLILAASLLLTAAGAVLRLVDAVKIKEYLK